MDFRSFMGEFESLKDGRAKTIAQIKSHNLPVIIYGAGELAKSITKEFADSSFDVHGYAVDDAYYTPNKTYFGKPVYRLSELTDQPGKYVFVLGVSDYKNENRLARDFLKNEPALRYVIMPSISDKAVDYNYVRDNRDAFAETYSLFDDDISRETMIDYLKVSISRNLLAKAESFGKKYFNELTTTPESQNGLAYVDCGAYDGDTIRKFLNFSGGKYSKIWAIEPDKESFAKLEDFVNRQGYKNISLFNCGLWDRKGSLHFNHGGSIYSTVSDNGGDTIPVDTLDNIIGDESVDFMKIAVQSSAFPTLKGAKSIVGNCRPILIVNIQYRAEDLITIPQFIRSLYGGYRLYLRHYDISLSQLILYAVP